MDSSPSRLTRFQWEVLKAFFERERGFFLTGGGALVGFHLRHRWTEDLDLFTEDASVFERGPHALADTVAALDAEMVVRQQATGFHRYVVTRGDEAVVVDMVHDHVPQLHVEKLEQQGVRVDLPEEILVNKLNTIASRCEARDLVDVMILERAGFRVEDALEGALLKDGGCTPATLAWVLSQVTIPDGAEMPGDISGTELRTYVEQLIRRLRKAALPESPGS